MPVCSIWVLGHI